MNKDPPPAPLYLHDLADLLHAHLLTHSSATSHYEHLRTLYNTHSFSRLHTSSPRTLPHSIYTQHLFQAALTLTPSLLQQLCCPKHTTIPISATLALITLFYVTQPLPQQKIRITQKSLQQLCTRANSSREAAQLLNYLYSVNAFLVVPHLVHSSAHAPNNLAANPFPPLLRFWRPSLMYGYHVSSHAVAEALNDWQPLCPAASAAKKTPKAKDTPKTSTVAGE